jgi:hypothetical protein
MVAVKTSRKPDAGRDAGGFVALPWSVLDCPAYRALSHPARALLLELARQYVRDNNGRLLASRAHLAARGWTSNDTLGRALRELLAAGFVFQTVRGHRPNRASWYALTWFRLDKLPGFDAGAAEGFRRGAYLAAALPTPKPSRDELYQKWRTPPTTKNASLTPSHGPESRPIAPPHGPEPAAVAPSHGPIGASFGGPPSPSHGHHLEMPSVGRYPRLVRRPARLFTDLLQPENNPLH